MNKRKTAASSENKTNSIFHAAPVETEGKASPEISLSGWQIFFAKDQIVFSVMWIL